MYIWEHATWPEFTCDESRLARALAQARHQQGRLLGKMDVLGFQLRDEVSLRSLTREVLTTSAIEGEKLDPEQIRSSIARRLGIDVGGLTPASRHVEGIVELMLDATQRYSQSLDEERLYNWHASLFPTGRSGLRTIKVGQWRDDKTGPMQVVSGPAGREYVHYQAPPADRLNTEISAFLDWFNGESEMDEVLKAGIAHLWFVTIHPFDDGNGRIARVIAEMTLARSESSSHRFYSISSQIRQEQQTYYDILERTQKRTLDITDWLSWFLGCMTRTIDLSHETLAAVIDKARFWEGLAAESLNPRQINMLNRIMDGLEGKLTSSKWARMAK